MLKQVMMKEYAIAELEIDKEKTKDILSALSEAIKSLEIDKDEFTNNSICTLMNLKGIFQSFKERLNEEAKISKYYAIQIVNIVKI
jgi:polyphosphate kinase